MLGASNIIANPNSIFDKSSGLGKGRVCAQSVCHGRYVKNAWTLHPHVLDFPTYFANQNASNALTSTRKLSHKHSHIGPLQRLESYLGNAL
jgi:hypothetical protein